MKKKKENNDNNTNKSKSEAKASPYTSKSTKFPGARSGFFFDRFKNHIERHLRNVEEAEHLDDIEKYWLRAATVRAADENLGKLKEWLRREYGEEIRLKSEWRGRKWMVETRKDRKRMEETKFDERFGYLWDKAMSLESSRELAERFGFGKYRVETKNGREVLRDYVLVVPNYNHMQSQLRMSKDLIRKFLRACCRAGFVMDLGKMGPRGQKVYAIGTWVPWGQSQFRKNPFLKKSSETVKAWRDFTLR